MNDFSLILKDVTLILSNEFLKQRGKDFQKTIRHFWQTHGVGDYRLNLMEILNNQYHRGPFVDTPMEIFEFSTTYKKIKIQIFLTKPSKNGAKVMLTKKNLHHFLNRKPVDIVLPFKTLFYELYQSYPVKKDTALPFVWMHFETEDLNSYEIRVLHDVRYVSFPAQDEAALLRKLQSEITMKFKEHYSAQSETKAEKSEVKKQQSSDPVVKEAMFKDKVQALKDRMRNVMPNNPYTTKKEESPPPASP
jgi:hypothetical protein